VVRKEMRRLEAAGELAAESAQFLQAPRATEELYDLESDPWELRNLIAEPSMAEVASRLRQECDRWQLEFRDAHLIPEPLLDSGAVEVGSRWALVNGPDGEERVRVLLKVAKAAADRSPASVEVLQEAVDHVDPAVRWWAVTGLRHLEDPDGMAAVFEAASRDPEPAVAIAGAAAVAAHVDFERGCRELAKFLGEESEFVQYAAMLELDEFGADAVRLTRDAIKSVGTEDYSGRLATHALSQLRDDR
jgi:hypothetical protein